MINRLEKTGDGGETKKKLWRRCRSWFEPWEMDLPSITTSSCHLYEELSLSTIRSISSTTFPRINFGFRSNHLKPTSHSLWFVLLIWAFFVFRHKVGTFRPFCWVKFGFWICSGGFVFGYADLMRRVSRGMGLSTMGACSVLGTCWCHGALVASPRSQQIGAVSLSLSLSLSLLSESFRVA